MKKHKVVYIKIRRQLFDLTNPLSAVLTNGIERKHEMRDVYRVMRTLCIELWES